MKGSNPSEFESQVNFLIWETYPRESGGQTLSSSETNGVAIAAHSHTQKNIPALDSLSTDPILFTQVPTLDTVSAKLISFIESSSLPQAAVQVIKQRFTNEIIPYLKSRFPASQTGKPAKVAASKELLGHWTETTRVLCTTLSPAQLFPLVDMWRLAVLDETVANFCASAAGGSADPIQMLLVQGLANISSPTPARNFTLTLLRMLANAFASPALASAVIRRKPVMTIIVTNLLHADAAVRTAASSLAFNIAACIQKERLEQVRKKYGPFAQSEEDGDWEVEILSAVLEAVGNEKESEEVCELSFPPP